MQWIWSIFKEKIDEIQPLLTKGFKLLTNIGKTHDNACLIRKSF